MYPNVDQVIHNKYRILQKIGEGGMGRVYQAEHITLGTHVALKFLSPELSEQPILAERFLQEARISAKIQSIHVAKVSDIDRTENGLAFMVMDFVEGKTLREIYDEYKTRQIWIPFGQAANYAIQLFEGMISAHQKSVVHRDLKPENIMITSDDGGNDLIKILDFGIAKSDLLKKKDRSLTRPGTIMGTPDYMSPEQVYSADLADVRSDIFSLGVILYELFSGVLPIRADNPYEIASSYIRGEAVPLTEVAPQIPHQLCFIIHRAISGQPNDRFNSMELFYKSSSIFLEVEESRGTEPLILTNKKPIAQKLILPNEIPAAESVIKQPIPIEQASYSTAAMSMDQLSSLLEESQLAHNKKTDPPTAPMDQWIEPMAPYPPQQINPYNQETHNDPYPKAIHYSSLNQNRERKGNALPFFLGFIFAAGIIAFIVFAVVQYSSNHSSTDKDGPTSPPLTVPTYQSQPVEQPTPSTVVRPPTPSQVRPTIQPSSPPTTVQPKPSSSQVGPIIIPSDFPHFPFPIPSIFGSSPTPPRPRPSSSSRPE